MSRGSLVRQDKYGPFIRTGGYIFRPQLSVNAERQGYSLVALSAPGGGGVDVGHHVAARHVSGTTTAKVADQTWYSHGESSYWDGSASRLKNSTLAWEPATRGTTTWPQQHAAHPYIIQEQP